MADKQKNALYSCSVSAIKKKRSKGREEKIELNSFERQKSQKIKKCCMMTKDAVLQVTLRIELALRMTMG